MTIETTKIPASMSGSRLKVLCALADAEEQGGSLTLGDLAKVAGISTAAITGVMDSMTRDGLAQRLRAADDRRKQIVELTRKGLALVTSMRPKQSDVSDQSDLSEASQGKEAA